MKTMNLFCVPVILCALNSAAAALELGAKQQSRQESLNGNVFKKVQKGIKRRVHSPRHKAADLLRELTKRGLMQDRAADASVGATWQEDGAAQRRTFRRVLKGGALFGAMARYKNRRPALTDSRAIQRAAAAVQLVTSLEGVLGSGERFLPEFTKVERFRGVSVSTGQQENFIVAAQVFLRRHLGDVPVLGPEGQASVLFDADGSLLELDFPMTSYEGGAPRRPDPGRARVKRAFLGSGYDVRPTRVGQIVSKNGTALELLDLQCGYRDDASKPELEVGCHVSAADGLSTPRVEFVPVD